ncbi:MAG: Imm70 family immunity protein, partial [Acutalibacteraceae bacterium]|nr:Imm70 family immunity protein [Acutalibacteraceae bacterium]
MAYNLEKQKWGTRFPVIMNTLYQGMVNQDEIDEAINELSIIKLELEKFPPDKVIWDI